MDVLLQALADSHRRTVLEALRARPATAGELAALLPIARPGVSRHLRVLREAGLVRAEARAQQRVYTLVAEPLAELDVWLGGYRALWQHRMQSLHTEVARGNSTSAARPRPKASSPRTTEPTTTEPTTTARTTHTRNRSQP